MARYLITEKAKRRDKKQIKCLQSINCYRRGEVIEAENLTQAKRKASRMQFFEGTVLVIEIGSFLENYLPGEGVDSTEHSDTRFEKAYKIDGEWVASDRLRGLQSKKQRTKY